MFGKTNRFVSEFQERKEGRKEEKGKGKEENKFIKAHPFDF